MQPFPVRSPPDRRCDPGPQSSPTTRVGVVLSGGGLRGAGHIGVLRKLIAHGVPVDVIVGASAGAIVAAYYAAVGLTLDELSADAKRFRGRHLVAHGLNVRSRRRLDWLLGPLSGPVRDRLTQLDRASFDRLHHGVSALGIVCHDLSSGAPAYFATGSDRGVRLSDVVRASAAMPALFPASTVRCEGTSLRLSDGGLSDGLPVQFARRLPLGATHLIVSDCRWLAGPAPEISASLVYIRPRLTMTGTLWAPGASLRTAIREGAAAVTADALAQVQAWQAPMASHVRP